jgi:hypothetical protein
MDAFLSHNLNQIEDNIMNNATMKNNPGSAQSSDNYSSANVTSAKVTSNSQKTANSHGYFGSVDGVTASYVLGYN